MKLGEIDRTLRPRDIKLTLCKPDRTEIYPLKDVHNAEFSSKLGKVSELTFTIPSTVERDHKLVENPLIDKIKHRYLVKLEYNHVTEYLIFLEENKTFANNDENISYLLYGEGYSLADKTIRDYEAVSKTLSQIAGEVLAETIWKVGYVDGYIDTLYRSHDIPSQTVLQAIYELAEKFNAVIIWDTVNFKINFYNPSNIGLNKGLRFKEGKYLESFNVSTTSHETVTRLRVYGADGLSIRRLTPTGVNYLEDFSWFMYPFERDANGNVIKRSDYMSDSLCIALEDYSKKLAQNGGEFDRLSKLLTEKQDVLQQKDQELSVLDTELIQILDILDILNADGRAGTPEHAQAVQDRANKESQIASKEAEILTVENEIKTIQEEMQNLRITLIIENNLTPENLLELNKFIIMKDYTNDTIIDDEDLLADGIQAFNEFREPSLSLTMSIENFLSNIEAQHDWNKLGLGDIVKIESKRLRVGIEAKIIEIKYNIDNDSIDLVIANEKELKDDFQKMLDDLYNANQTSTTVNMNKFKWGLIEDTNSVVSQMLNEAWSSAKQKITAGYAQNIVISERGIVVKSPQDPRNWLVLQNGMLALTGDDGNTWQTAITPEGVVASRLIGRIIMGSRLIIEDESGIIRLSGSLQEVFDQNGNVKVALGQYATGKYGLKINDGAIELRTASSPNRGLELDVNGLRLFNNSGTKTFEANSNAGTVSIVGSLDIRTSPYSNSGVVFNGSGISAYDYNGRRQLHIDTNGYITANTGTFSGHINAYSGSFSGSLYGADITGATGTFSGTLSAGTVTSSTITGGTITGATISGNTINGGSINGSTDINISRDVYVGNNIYLANSSSYRESRSIIFAGSAGVTYESDVVSVTSVGSVNLESSTIRILGSLDLSRTNSVNWGSNRPTAVWG